MYDPDATMIQLATNGEKTIPISLRDARDLIKLVLTIPDLTKRIDTLEKARGTSNGR